MESHKRTYNEVDPDYIFPENKKIMKNDLEMNVSPSVNRAAEIVRREFNTEIMYKEQELDKIEDRLKIAMKTLQLLRSVCVSTYYNRNELILNVFNDSEKYTNPNSDCLFGPQTKPHPAIKKIVGKAPLQLTQNRTRPKKISKHINLTKDLNHSFTTEYNETISANDSDNEKQKTDLENAELSSNSSSENESSTVRNERFKTKYKIIVGNISKWLVDTDSLDKSTHKWMVYVRGPRENPDISHFVQKVRFFLHPSYRPNDIIEVENAPFHLSRRGWGEFPLRVQIHFSNSVNKPIDVIHNLKLDQTHTGLETLGAETLVDVWLYTKSINKLNTLKCRSTESEFVNLHEESDEDIENSSSNLLFVSRTNHFNQISVNSDNARNIVNNSIDRNSFKNLNNCSSNTSPNSNSSPTDVRSSNICRNICTDIPNQSFSHTPDNSLSQTELLNNSVLNCKRQNLKINSFNCSTELYNDKRCSLKNNESKCQVSLLKSKSVDNVLDLVVVRTFEDVHNYCKKPVNNDATHTVYSELPLFDNKISKFQKQCFSCMETVVIYLLKHLPLVTIKASDIGYLQCHPYAARSLEEFMMWSKVKQFCSEWYRAKMVKQIITKNEIFQHERWSTKSILKFARLTGFSTELKMKIDSRSTSCLLKQDTENNFLLRTYTENPCFRKKYPSQNMDSHDLLLDNEEIDVVNVISPKKEVIQNSPQKVSSEEIVQFSENDDLPKFITNSSFIKDVVSEIGLTLQLEEINPNQWAPTSEICLLVATKCLIEDLIRRSLIRKRCDNSKEIEINDIKNGLLKRNEFDIFLNCGLGKKVF